MKKAVFLDKDGTLIPNIPYNVDPDRIRLTEGAAEGLRRLQKAGFRLIVISNQSGVARGLFAERDLEGVERKLQDLLGAQEVELDGFYYCPHHEEGTIPEYTRACACRKPEPGMLLQAAREHDLDLESCWMVGDILNDVEAGRRAGCKTVLIDNGNETEWELSPLRTPDYYAVDLSEAAEKIIRETERSNGSLRPNDAFGRE